MPIKTKAKKASEHAANQPVPERPSIPGYGIRKNEKGMLRWDDVAAQIEKSRNYWVCTTRADGRPHAMPVWGVFVDGAVVFGTGVETVKARNLATSSKAVIHLESGDEAVILEGDCLPVKDADMLKRAGDAYEAKYKLRGTDMPGSRVYSLRPSIVLAWLERQFPASATRWKFPRE